MAVQSEKILAEIEDVIRSLPPAIRRGSIDDEALRWLGRARAIMHQWDPVRTTEFNFAVGNIRSPGPLGHFRGVDQAIMLLHQASAELRLKLSGPLSVPIVQGNRFQFFDEMRKIIETAKIDIFFVDPYLDPEFVSNYLPQVDSAAAIRLLANRYVNKLLPAVKLFRETTSTRIELRSAPDFHDRFVFIDRQACFHSSASFKDGAKNAPTLLAQVSDAFEQVSETYDKIWHSAKIEMS